MPRGDTGGDLRPIILRLEGDAAWPPGIVTDSPLGEAGGIPIGLRWPASAARCARCR